MTHRKRHPKSKTDLKTKKNRGQWISHFNPFAGIPRDALVAQITALGQKKAEDFPNELAELKKTMLMRDPISLLGTLGFYSQSAFVKEDGRVEPPQDGIQQHHVELLQALALQSDLSEYQNNLPSPPLVQLIMDRVRGVSEALVVGKNIDRQDHPMSFVAFYSSLGKQEAQIV